MGKSDTKNTRDSRVRGIGLLELSFFIAASGLLVATGAPFYKVYENHKHMDVTTATLAQVKTALNTYYQKNGVLPCPAPRNKAFDNPGFGKSVTGSSACSTATITTPVELPDGTAEAPGRIVTPTSWTTATPPAPVGSPWPIRIGAIPVRTLGLPDSAATDSWGNLLTYAVTETYAVPGAAPQDMLHGAITIKDSQNHDVTASPGIAVFAVVAAGADNVGAWRPETGTQPTLCTSSSSSYHPQTSSSPAGSYNTAPEASSLAANSSNDTINCSDTGQFRATTLMSNSSTHLFTNMVAFQADTQACSPQTTAAYTPGSVVFLIATNSSMGTPEIATAPGQTCPVMAQAATTLN